MGIEKNTSVILSCLPYRETSLLMSLFSHQHGRLNVLAKGVRKADKKGNSPIDRGYLIEHVVYLKQHRELYLVTGLQILEYYPEVRGNLEKTAVRDTLFEFLLAAIRVADPHPELFICITSFLDELSRVTSLPTIVVLLWRTLLAVVHHLGFGLQATCGRCGNTLFNTAALLDIEQGALFCPSCIRGSSASERIIGSSVLQQLFFSDDPAIAEKTFTVDKCTMVALTNLFFNYCRYHCEVRVQLKSLFFLEQVVLSANRA